ncbi:OmpA family protein [Sinobacterium norvegicum]|nr:OmpA family protein [Sinobacterium norvegicum]
MKNKKTIGVILLASSLLVGQAQAASNTTALKQGSVFFGAAAVGAVAGGPVGFIIGAIAGGYLGEQIKTADELPAVNNALAETQHELMWTEQALVDSQQQLSSEVARNNELAETALDQLQLALLFTTGGSLLSEQDIDRLEQLSVFLTEHPQLSVRLDGYADPRGSAEFNQQLSEQRVASVQALLTAFKIESNRIETVSHGDSQAELSDNSDNYAMDRLVTVRLHRVPMADVVAQINP